jgi:hypothetical protein
VYCKACQFMVPYTSKQSYFFPVRFMVKQYMYNLHGSQSMLPFTLLTGTYLWEIPKLVSWFVASNLQPGGP